MRPFNLDEYLKNPSRKVVTKDGRNVRILCTDARGSFPIVALVEASNDVRDNIYIYTKEGHYYEPRSSFPNNLFFAPEKKEGWTNIYRGALDITYTGSVYDSKKEAEEHIDDTQRYIATSKIEWEE